MALFQAFRAVRPASEKAEKVAGQLRRTEELLHTEKLRAAGIREE